MTEYKRGSKGGEVKKIQEKLAGMGIYQGPIDGDFGGGTESAVKNFQQKKKLKVDGVVGPRTWELLFKEEIPEPAISSEDLDFRSVALTGAFETGRGVPECFAGLSGDFDGQGISFGVLQWNFGQDSLQPLLKEMMKDHPAVMKGILHEYYPVAVKALNATKEELMAFSRGVQHPVKHYLYEPWRGMFKALGRTVEFQKIQVKAANKLYRSALALCKEYGLWSERAVALMFDIKVQNGSISPLVKAQIMADSKACPMICLRRNSR